MLVFYHTYSFVLIEFELNRLTNGFPTYFLFYYHLKSIKITVGVSDMRTREAEMLIMLFCQFMSMIYAC